MNLFRRIYCRIYQGVYRFAMHFIRIPLPKVIEGEGSSTKIGDILFEHKINKVLVVTDEFLFNSGLLDAMINSFTERGISYAVFKDVVANPPIDVIEKAIVYYQKEKCQALVAFGGGSPMDTAKAIGARISCPKKSIPQMKGQLKIGKKLPLLIALPTTAGTGSEATLAAVVSNHETNEKYSLNDPVLVPQYAILDPLLIKDLPGKITSTTGMDALTHAVEAYIGHSTTRITRVASIKACKLIFDNLEETYNNPHNMLARNNMLKASYYAGVAFTRAYVGYVHAIAHTLGGFYNVPHGLANAIILPYVLEKFGPSAYKKLAELSDAVNLTDSSLSDELKAKAFINKIKEMNTNMGIPNKIKGVIKDSDIPLMVERADAEGNPLYPVPKLWSKQDFEEIYKEIKDE